MATNWPSSWPMRRRTISPGIWRGSSATRPSARWFLAAGQVRGGSPEAIQNAQQLGAVVGARRYSQEFELEADALGTVIAARAGFDPVRGAQFFFRLPDPGNRILGTHPPNAERVEIVNQTAAALGL